MQVKTSELTGTALDWAVAHLWSVEIDDQHRPIWFDVTDYGVEHQTNFSPSTNWAQGGPIIERESIGFFQKKDDGYCQASKPGAEFVMRGLTPLIAAMRCFVASKCGDTIDVPDSLIGE